MSARKRKWSMVDFIIIKNEDRLKKELKEELKPAQWGSLEVIIKYIDKYKKNEISEEETYSKIPYSYRDILDVLDNQKIRNYIQTLGYHDLFEQNIEKAKQDRGKLYF